MPSDTGAPADHPEHARRPFRAAHRLLRRHHRGAACAGRGARGGGRGGGRRRSALAAAAADRLGLELVVSYASDDFAEAQAAQRALAAAAALCGAARHAAADAEECLAGIEPTLPGLIFH